MKIALIGPGAMGQLFGGYLSRHNDVTLIGHNPEKMREIDRVAKHLRAAPDGFTSIYADLKAGRITEVPVINGAVVANAKRLGVPAPTHELVVEMVHAMEGRGR